MNEPIAAAKISPVPTDTPSSGTVWADVRSADQVTRLVTLSI